MAKRKWWQWLASVLGLTGAAASYLADRQNGSGIQGTEAGNQLNSFIDSKTGAHLTGAQREANDFSARMAEEEYARQEEFYLKYQSPKAMLRQGVNPFGINGSTGGQSVTGGAPQSVSPSAPQAPDLFSIVQMLFGMQQQKRLNDSEIGLREAQSGLIQQQTLSQQNQNSVFGVLHNLSLEQIRAGIDEKRQAINESLQRVKESVSRISVNNSQIELNGSLVQLHGSEVALNASKTAVENLNAEKLKLLMPYIQARQEAEIALARARTEQALMSAEKAMYDANVAMLQGMVQADLIDSGYYDELMKQMRFETAIQDWKSKSIKRDYNWKPINDVCRNLSMVATSAAAVIGSVTGATGGVPAAAAMSYGSDPALGSAMFF